MAPRDQSNHLWDSSGQITSTGSANAYVIATAASLTGYIQGMDPIRFKANFTCSGSSTVNINGIGAATLKKYGGATNLASGDIVSGGIYTLSYDGTNFQVLELNSTATSVTGFPMTASGDRWGVIAPVAADGVMEVGRYIDFHTSDGDTSDFAARLDAGGGALTLSGVPLVVPANFFVNRAGGDEGGEMYLQAPSSGHSLGGDVVFDVAGNLVRIFEAGGSFRGVNIDLTACASSAGTSLLPSLGVALLSSGSVSNAATMPVLLTGMSAYRMLKILLSGVLPATDGVNLLMRSSTNGGSSYDSAAGNYDWTLFEQFASVGTNQGNSTGDTQISLTEDGIGNASSEGLTGWVEVIGHTSAALFTKFRHNVSWMNDNATTATVGADGAGTRRTAADVDAVTFFMSSGNITGSYAVYGYA
jgi:hypothetical protein